MELKAYSLLGTCSRRAITRKRGKYGHLSHYVPRNSLLVRISWTLKISVSEAYSLLMSEREYLLRQK
jgi:hypothetical protein